jgi:orotidine-5'-phosphate decarboxylase
MTLQKKRGFMRGQDSILVALDFPTLDQAAAVAAKLKDKAKFKVGMQLCTAAGPPNVVNTIGQDVFLDLKFHDIPNTVAGAVAAASDLGVWMVNVHCLGGEKMMRAARNAADEAFVKSKKRPLIIGVTILTSHDLPSLKQIGIEASTVEEAVAKLAKLAVKCGLDGVVCSPREITAVREAVCDGGFIIVTPGIRAADALPDDQMRTMTAGEAIRRGSTYVVIGRPITGAEDPVLKYDAFANEIDLALQSERV